MPAYNLKRAYPKSTRVTIRGVVKRPYRSSGGYGGGTPMQLVSSGLAPLRSGGFFGTRRTMQEKKTVDVDPTTGLFDTTGTVTLLNGVAVGTDFTDRVGRKILMKSLFIRGCIGPVDNDTADNASRLLIVYDMQANGVAPAITDVLKSSSPYAQLNLNNRDRFKVLVDKLWNCGKSINTATQAVSNSPTVYSWKRYIRMSREVLFQGTAATVASIATGSVYLITLGDQAPNGGSKISYSCRIRFTDS